jgi:hypothetical protein
LIFESTKRHIVPGEIQEKDPLQVDAINKRLEGMFKDRRFVNTNSTPVGRHNLVPFWGPIYAA